MMSATLSLPALAPVVTEETLREMPMPPWAYGAIALGVILALLGVVWMFRHTAQVVLDGRPHRAGDAHHEHADLHGAGGHAQHGPHAGQAGRTGHTDRTGL